MSESQAPDGAGSATAPVREAIERAIFGVGTGDPEAWQAGVRTALALDPAAADRISRTELAERARRHGIDASRRAEIVAGTTVLARATDGGPFQCPAYLFELALRRALGEPGCVDFVDETELIYAGTQCAGMIDLHDVLLPDGWGWTILLPLESGT